MDLFYSRGDFFFLSFPFFGSFFLPEKRIVINFVLFGGFFWLVCLTRRRRGMCSFHYLTHRWGRWRFFVCIFLDLLFPQEGQVAPLYFFVSSPFTDSSLFNQKALIFASIHHLFSLGSA